MTLASGLRLALPLSLALCLVLKRASPCRRPQGFCRLQCFERLHRHSYMQRVVDDQMSLLLAQGLLPKHVKTRTKFRTFFRKELQARGNEPDLPAYVTHSASDWLQESNHSMSRSPQIKSLMVVHLRDARSGPGGLMTIDISSPLREEGDRC